MLRKKWLWTVIVLGLLCSSVSLLSQTNVTSTFRKNRVVIDSLTAAANDTSVVYQLDGYSQRYNPINNIRVVYYGNNIDSVSEFWIEGSMDNVKWTVIDSSAISSTTPSYFDILRASAWKFFRFRKATASSDTTNIIFMLKGGN